jgi:hypothetical protein
MAEISMDAVRGQMLAVLKEAFEGPSQSWSYFTDHGVDGGLLGTLSGLNAARASRLWGGSSIAAHTHHAAFGLAASSAWIRGDRASRDWRESWQVSTVDDAAWAHLFEQLRHGYTDLRQAIESHAFSSVESVGGAVGAIAHAAYHLGAIRQKVAASRNA